MSHPQKKLSRDLKYARKRTSKYREHNSKLKKQFHHLQEHAKRVVFSDEEEEEADTQPIQVPQVNNDIRYEPYSILPEKQILKIWRKLQNKKKTLKEDPADEEIMDQLNLSELLDQEFPSSLEPNKEQADWPKSLFYQLANRKMDHFGQAGSGSLDNSSESSDNPFRSNEYEPMEDDNPPHKVDDNPFLSSEDEPEKPKKVSWGGDPHFEWRLPTDDSGKYSAVPPEYRTLLQRTGTYLDYVRKLKSLLKAKEELTPEQLKEVQEMEEKVQAHQLLSQAENAFDFKEKKKNLDRFTNATIEGEIGEDDLFPRTPSIRQQRKEAQAQKNHNENLDTKYQKVLERHFDLQLEEDEDQDDSSQDKLIQETLQNMPGPTVLSPDEDPLTYIVMNMPRKDQEIIAEQFAPKNTAPELQDAGYLNPDEDIRPLLADHFEREQEAEALRRGEKIRPREHETVMENLYSKYQLGEWMTQVEKNVNRVYEKGRTFSWFQKENALKSLQNPDHVPEKVFDKDEILEDPDKYERFTPKERIQMYMDHFHKDRKDPKRKGIPEYDIFNFDEIQEKYSHMSGPDQVFRALCMKRPEFHIPEGLGFDEPHSDNFARVYQQAVYHKDPAAMFLLGLYYENGFTAPENRTNPREAYHWYLKSALAGFPAAIMMMAYMYEYGEVILKPDHAVAYLWYQEGAKQDLSECIYRLGEYHLTGKGDAELNFSKALEYLQRAADLENVKAQCSLARCYLYAQGVDEDPKKAYYWMSKAADQLFPPALIEKGHFLKNGYGTPQDLKEAFYCFSKAIPFSPEATYQVGLFHWLGYAPDGQSFAGAVKYMQMGADAGDPDCIHGLAVLHLEGRVTGKMEPLVYITMLQMAAASAHPESCFKLGLCHKMGWCVDREIGTAAFYLVCAEYAGFEPATEELTSGEWNGFEDQIYHLRILIHHSQDPNFLHNQFVGIFQAVNRGDGQVLSGLRDMFWRMIVLLKTDPQVMEMAERFLEESGPQVVANPEDYSPETKTEDLPPELQKKHRTKKAQKKSPDQDDKELFEPEFQLTDKELEAEFEGRAYQVIHTQGYDDDHPYVLHAVGRGDLKVEHYKQKKKAQFQKRRMKKFADKLNRQKQAQERKRKKQNRKMAKKRKNKINDNDDPFASSSSEKEEEKEETDEEETDEEETDEEEEELEETEAEEEQEDDNDDDDELDSEEEDFLIRKKLLRKAKPSTNNSEPTDWKNLPKLSKFWKIGPLTELLDLYDKKHNPSKRKPWGALEDLVKKVTELIQFEIPSFTSSTVEELQQMHEIVFDSINDIQTFMSLKAAYVRRKREALRSVNPVLVLNGIRHVLQRRIKKGITSEKVKFNKADAPWLHQINQIMKDDLDRTVLTNLGFQYDEVMKEAENSIPKTFQEWSQNPQTTKLDEKLQQKRPSQMTKEETINFLAQNLDSFLFGAKYAQRVLEETEIDDLLREEQRENRDEYLFTNAKIQVFEGSKQVQQARELLEKLDPDANAEQFQLYNNYRSAVEDLETQLLKSQGMIEEATEKISVAKQRIQIIIDTNFHSLVKPPRTSAQLAQRLVQSAQEPHKQGHPATGISQIDSHPEIQQAQQQVQQATLMIQQAKKAMKESEDQTEQAQRNWRATYEPDFVNVANEQMNEGLDKMEEGLEMIIERVFYRIQLKNKDAINPLNTFDARIETGLQVFETLQDNAQQLSETPDTEAFKTKLDEILDEQDMKKQAETYILHSFFPRDDLPDYPRTEEPQGIKQTAQVLIQELSDSFIDEVLTDDLAEDTKLSFFPQVTKPWQNELPDEEFSTISSQHYEESSREFDYEQFEQEFNRIEDDIEENTLRTLDPQRKQDHIAQRRRDAQIREAEGPRPDIGPNIFYQPHEKEFLREVEKNPDYLVLLAKLKKHGNNIQEVVQEMEQEDPALLEKSEKIKKSFEAHVGFEEIDLRPPPKIPRGKNGGFAFGNEEVNFEELMDDLLDEHGPYGTSETKPAAEEWEDNKLNELRQIFENYHDDLDE